MPGQVNRGPVGLLVSKRPTKCVSAVGAPPPVPLDVDPAVPVPTVDETEDEEEVAAAPPIPVVDVAVDFTPQPTSVTSDTNPKLKRGTFLGKT